MTGDDANACGGRRSSRRAFVRTLAALGVVGCLPWLTGCGGTADRVVEMTDRMAFAPAKLTIKVGSSVTWRNASRFPHSATADPAKAVDPTHVKLPEGAQPWDSRLLAHGQTWRHAFGVPGEYRYCCLPHELGGMVGTIVVER